MSRGSDRTTRRIHPLSQSKLRSACAVVLRSWAGRGELVADLCQEATCLVAARFRDGNIECPYYEWDAFGGWAFQLWFNACRRAWRQQFRHLRRTYPLEGCHEAVVWPDDTEDLMFELRLAIDDLYDPVLRRLMLDWSFGMSGSDSAQLHGLSPSTVSRYRQQGTAILRDRFGFQPADG